MATYTARAELYSNPTAKKLLALMDEKKTNLSVAVDVTTKKELLHLADVLGPYI
ncbi:orotidine 5'-phosphate decarboxylase, partial [Boothiomyces macroporosus]